jgi:septal ring factor EnvC (AmiA/AmiB activator)
MTTEERFERIEHVTAGLAEERRKDREEFRSLWRDTQRQLNELTQNVANLGDRIAALAEEAAARDRETDRRFQETDRRMRETDARIEKMTSAMGQFIALRLAESQPPSQG